MFHLKELLITKTIQIISLPYFHFFRFVYSRNKNATDTVTIFAGDFIVGNLQPLFYRKTLFQFILDSKMA